METTATTRPGWAEAFLDSFPQMACINGYKGQFLAVNPAFTAALGWTIADLRDVAYYDLVSASERKSMIKLGTLIIRHAGGEPRTYRRSLRHKDGSYRVVEWSAWADPGSSVVCAVGKVLASAANEPSRR